MSEFLMTVVIFRSPVQTRINDDPHP